MIDPYLERKLQFFVDTIQGEIEEKRALAKLSFQSKSKMRENLEQVQMQVLESASLIQDEIIRNANRDISQAKVRAITKYVQCRKEQIDRLFIDVRAKLAKFTQDAEYEIHLLQKIKEASVTGDFSIVELCPHDMRFESIIKSTTALTPALGSNFIGGFILFNQSRTLRADHSFETKLNTAQKEFRYDL